MAPRRARARPSALAAILPVWPSVRPAVRVQQRARQNHVLLRRSLELLDQFINSLCPAKAPVYDGTGSLLAGPETGASLYEAVG